MSVLPLPLIHMTQRPASYQWPFLPPQSELGLDRYVRHEDVVSVDEPFLIIDTPSTAQRARKGNNANLYLIPVITRAYHIACAI